MSIELTSEGEFLSLLANFSKKYLLYHNSTDLVKFAIETMSESKVINKVLYYQLDPETFDFRFVSANYEDCNGDLVFEQLVRNQVIVKTLSEVENSFFYDSSNNEYFICLPVLSFDGILGILVISSHLVNFEENEIIKSRMNTVANVIGLALNSLTSYIDKEHYKGLQEQIVAMKTIELRRNEHQLKLKMDQMTTNLNRSIPHEIRTPFLHIIGLSDMLLKHPEIDALDDSVEVKDIANDLNIAAKRLNSVLDNYIFYANLVTKSFNSEEIKKENSFHTEDVDSILFELVNEMAYKYNRPCDIQINVEPAAVVGSPSMINKLFFEIIDNAFKFSNSGNKVEINAVMVDSFFQISISDHGSGMTDEEIRGVGAFVQYNRDKQEQQGLGLGLAIAIKILAIINGDIDIVSKKGIYTEVKVKLKAYQPEI